MESFNLPSPLEKIDLSFFHDFQINVSIKRDDLIHSEVSGNKWRKLKLNLEKFKHGRYDALLTFGGAYSNHIAATAALGRIMGVKTIGIIRGEELSPQSNGTLSKAASDGMHLQFVSREEYSWRYETDYKNDLRARHGNCWIVEEGGANFYGMMGCTEIIGELEHQADYIILPAGTGTTAAGLLMAENRAKIIAVPVLANADFLREDIMSLLRYGGFSDADIEEKNEQLILPTEFAFGGYGRSTAELIDFMNQIYKESGLKLDHVYTGKMFFALHELVKRGTIAKNSRIVALHTGGLQGNYSIKESLIFD